MLRKGQIISLSYAKRLVNLGYLEFIGNQMLNKVNRENVISRLEQTMIENGATFIATDLAQEIYSSPRTCVLPISLYRQTERLPAQAALIISESEPLLEEQERKPLVI